MPSPEGNQSPSAGYLSAMAHLCVPVGHSFDEHSVRTHYEPEVPRYLGYLNEKTGKDACPLLEHRKL